MVPENQRDILAKILGPLELEVMQILWKKGTTTVQEVVDILNQEEKPYAYTTIMTIMSRLAEKAILERKKKGKTYLYSPKLPVDQFIKQKSSQSIQHLLKDYGEIAISQFVDAIGHSPDRLEKLKRYLNELEKDESK